MAYDLKTTCPAARWSAGAEGRLEFGAAGLEPCAVIGDGDGEPYGWAYRVHCAVVGKTFSSRAAGRDDCVKEACVWLRHVRCPGHIDRPAQAEAATDT